MIEILTGWLDDPRKRPWAAKALRLLGGIAVESLVAALQDEKFHARATAAGILGNINDERAVEPLISVVLGGDKIDAKRAAINAIRRIGGVGLLAELLKRENYLLWRLVCKELDRLNWRPIDESQQAVWSIVHNEWEKVVQLGGVAISPLIVTLKGAGAVWDRTEIQQNTVESLEKIGGERAVLALVSTFADGDEESSLLAKQSLLRIGKPVVPELVSQLGCDGRIILKRAIILELLGKIGDIGAIKNIETHIDNPSHEIRVSAVAALEGLGWQPKNDRQAAILAVVHGTWNKLLTIGEAAVEPLTVALRAANRNESDGNDIAEVLSRIGSKSAIRSLLQSWRILEVVHIGDSALQTVRESLNDPNPELRNASVRVLGCICDVRFIGQLYGSVHDLDPHVRAQSAWALGQICDQRTMEPLLTLLKDDDEKVRRVAASAIGRIRMNVMTSQEHWEANKEFVGSLSLEIGSYWYSCVGREAGEWMVRMDHDWKVKASGSFGLLINAREPSPSQKTEILKTLASQDFFGLEDDYTRDITHDSTRYLTIHIMGVSKHVHFYGIDSYVRDKRNGEQPHLRCGSTEGAQRFIEIWDTVERILGISIDRKNEQDPLARSLAQAFENFDKIFHGPVKKWW
jgi:HEAT repeat protein